MSPFQELDSMEGGGGEAADHVYYIQYPPKNAHFPNVIQLLKFHHREILMSLDLF
jgi:hypothetical protein